jgi:hypothetical protein
MLSLISIPYRHGLSAPVVVGFVVHDVVIHISHRLLAVHLARLVDQLRKQFGKPPDHSINPVGRSIAFVTGLP